MLKIFPEVTKKQVVETGVLLVAVFLLVGLYQHKYFWFQLALVGSVLILLVPPIFYPLARIWFALGQVLNRISSVVLLTLLFIVIVIPIATLKRIFGKDTLQLRKFKKDKESVFIERNHTFTLSDIQYPF
ncbi:SxtJ family membrane protein [Adhaeribacter radiodurans]|uniref:Uncharacterized protein n=1 Tax=Adhaeribacter radiodurans TaxID=2745197 RepID=A0A7L7L8K5_9BACT|nr:SxtJ family membrane protein [Adhaeribacter radiodurans]QMU29054.1 hypothetical protein HUW48_13840 [Adhaeribacter radiodurans]